MNPSQAETEARAKIIWGESPESVMEFLRGKGCSPYEARDLVDSFLQERRASLRQEGFKKVALGSALLAASIIGCVIILTIQLDHIETGKAIGLIALPGVYGAWKLIDGATLILSPDTTRGDLATRDDL